jgi:hypothetical protein
MRHNKIAHIPGILFDPEKQSFWIQKEWDDRSDSTVECPDMLTHYCKRYLLRLVKEIQK